MDAISKPRRVRSSEPQRQPPSQPAAPAAAPNHAPYLRVHFPGSEAARRIGAADVVAAVRAQIAQALAPAGSRLPPIRVLAHQLGVSKNTVQVAYDELVAQGLVEPRGRRGLFVAAREPAMAVAPARRAAAPAFVTLAPAPQGTLERDTIALSQVLIDPELLPVAQIMACLANAARRGRVPVLYERQGLRPLRELIAARLTDRGIPARADDVVTTVGSQQALDLLCRVLVDKSIATENPAYHLGKRLFELNGMRTVPLPLDPFRGVDLAAWEQRIATERPAALYVTTSFQNPTGYSYTTSELQEILRWSSAYGAGIIEDDWGSDMLSYSDFRPGLRALGGDHVIYINSFTKKLLPSLRLGYVLGNERTVPVLTAAKALTNLGTSAVVEVAVQEFLERGYYDAHLKRLHAELDARYRRCLEALRALMPPGVRWTSPGGGPVLWLEVQPGVDPVRVAERLTAKRVLLRSPTDAFFGAPHLRGFIIGYAFLPPEKMQRGLELLAAELRREAA